jgi:hypothetical protein
MTALAIMAGAIGPSARVGRSSTQESFSPQLFLIIHADSPPEWLPGLLSQIREYQRHLLAAAALGSDDGALQAKEARIKSEREQLLRNDRFPEKAHLDYFDRQLRTLNLQRRRLFCMDNPTARTILSLFERSADQCLLLIWTNPQSFSDVLHCRPECDLILRALSGEPFIQPGEDGGLILEGPGLSGIAACDGECLKDLIGADCDLFLEPGRVFIVDGSPQTRKTALPANPMQSFEWWHRLVDRVLANRFQQEPRLYSISPAAEDVLNAAHSHEFLQLWKKHEFPSHVSSELCSRFMLILHVCQDNAEKFIPEAAALSAVKIVCWLVAENHRVLSELKNEGLVEKRRADRARMLQKIREKGPLLKRELFRLFDIQTEAVHGPVLADLIRSGDVVKGTDGRLRVCGEKETASKSTTAVVTEISH